MIYNVAMVGRLFTKFQVNTCKTRKDRSAHAQLHQAMIYNVARVRRLSTKLQVDTCKLKKIDLSMRSCALVVEIQAMIYNAAKVRRLSTIFQGDTCKTKKKKE